MSNPQLDQLRQSYEMAQVAIRQEERHHEETMQMLRNRRDMLREAIMDRYETEGD